MQERKKTRRLYKIREEEGKNKSLGRKSTVLHQCTWFCIWPHADARLVQFRRSEWRHAPSIPQQEPGPGHSSPVLALGTALPACSQQLQDTRVKEGWCEGQPHSTHTRAFGFVHVHMHLYTPSYTNCFWTALSYPHCGLIPALCFKQLPEFRNRRSKYFHLLLGYSRKSHVTFRQIFRYSAMFSLKYSICMYMLCKQRHDLAGYEKK